MGNGHKVLRSLEYNIYCIYTRTKKEAEIINYTHDTESSPTIPRTLPAQKE
jgi:hypothetical protein